MDNKEIIALTQKQQYQMTVLIKLINNVITIEEAARLLKLSCRQVSRKKKAYQEQGAKSLIHKNIGRSSARGYSSDLKQEILRLYKEEYPGWNFSHFRDALEDNEHINVSNSFIQKFLKANGISSPKKKRRSKNRPHPPRPRREKAGELIQVDASKHQWLFGTEKHFYLHGAIDDATGIVTACFLMEQETTYGYQIILRDTIRRYGFPACLYTDYRTVFQSNKKLTYVEIMEDKEIKATRYAEMLDHLGISITSTTDPRSKGRIERLWGTFQDRLVKELHRAKIDTIKEANEYINKHFLPKYNARFASTIDYNKNSFIPADENFDYNQELALTYRRRVLEECYIRIDNKVFVIQRNGRNCKLRMHHDVFVYIFLDGTYHLRDGDKWYDLKEVHPGRCIGTAKISPETIATGKTLKQRSAPWKDLPKEDRDKLVSEKNRKNSMNSPWRTYFKLPGSPGNRP